MLDIYQEIIIEESKNPKNFGSLDSPDMQATDGNASCGDTVTVQIDLSQDQKTIESVKWHGDGCSVAKSAMSLLSQDIIGKDVFAVDEMDQEDMLALLGMETISSGRVRCLMVGLKTVQIALKNTK